MLPVSVGVRGGPVLSAPWLKGRGSAVAPDVFVSHTVFGYDRWRDLPAIGTAAVRAAQLWRKQPGALWLLQWMQPGRRLMGDLSVWSSADDLGAFLVLPQHTALVEQWRDRMRGVHHSWTEPAADVDRARIWTAALAATAETRRTTQLGVGAPRHAGVEPAGSNDAAVSAGQ